MSENKAIYKKDNGRVEATVFIGSPKLASGSDGFTPKATVETTTDGKIALWYSSNNTFPDDVKKDIEATPQLASTLYWKANALISGGLQYGYEEYDDSGKIILLPQKIAEIEAFLFNTNIKLVLRELTHEFYRYWNAFPQLIRPKGSDKFTGIKVQDSIFCRWGMQNNNGLIDTCYVSPDWKLKGWDPVNGKIIQAIYRNLDRIESTRERRAESFIYPVAGTSSGNLYYELAPWNSIRESGWLSFLKQIPTFKEAMIKNMMGARYHIEMPDWWMEYKYRDSWQTKTEAQKLQLYNDEFDTFKAFVCGPENAGMAIMTTAMTNELTKEKYPGWTFTLIETPKLDSAYNDDLEIASSMLYNSLGVHGSVVATLPGKSGLGSKGSEIRNLFNMYISNSKPEQDIILEPLEFIAMYNKWGTMSKPIKFWFHNYWLTTLDEVSPANRNFNAKE